MTAPLVSVVVPAYNHAAYVARALDSVAAQTYPALELIAIDDASPDDTARIISDWASADHVARRFARIEVVRHEHNRGAAASLNHGLARARGEFVCLLNSDDFFAPSRIRVLLDALRRESSRFAFSAVMPVDAADQPTLRSTLAHQIVAVREDIAVLPSVSFGFLHRQLAISTGNFLFHRSLAEDIGGFASLRYCHDWDFALRAFLRTEPVFVDEALYFYRLHPANSFTALRPLAHVETEAVLRGHYSRCFLDPVPNDRAPTPDNWPGVFEHYIAFFGLQALWHQVRAEHGAPPAYPTPTGPARPARHADAHEPRLDSGVEPVRTGAPRRPRLREFLGRHLKGGPWGAGQDRAGTPRGPAQAP